MKAIPPDRHQLAIAILAIATAAIGFGLFGGDLPVGELIREDRFAAGIQYLKLMLIAVVVVSYFAVAISVARILPEDRVTGRQLAYGPMQWLVIEMAALAALYLILLIAELAGE